MNPGLVFGFVVKLVCFMCFFNLNVKRKKQKKKVLLPNTGVCGLAVSPSHILSRIVLFEGFSGM